MTSRFVAGQTLEDALAVGRKVSREGLMLTLDHLGESVSSPEEAEASRYAYLDAIERISAEKLPATVSIKPSQFGMERSEEACRRNVEALVARASQSKICVEVDMEASQFVDPTLRLVRDLHARHGSVRAVIQAYLRRSESDLEALCGQRIPVRLCKGAYKEPAAIAFASRPEVDANYLRLTGILMERGVYPGIATHDPRMVEGAIRHAQRLGLDPGGFEFQMLYGIQRELQRRLVAGGYRLRLYVPYGDAWYPYFMRRLAEHPPNLLLVARNLFRR